MALDETIAAEFRDLSKSPYVALFITAAAEYLTVKNLSNKDSLTQAENTLGKAWLKIREDFERLELFAEPSQISHYLKLEAASLMVRLAEQYPRLTTLSPADRNHQFPEDTPMDDLASSIAGLKQLNLDVQNGLDLYLIGNEMAQKVSMTTFK